MRRTLKTLIIGVLASAAIVLAPPARGDCYDDHCARTIGLARCYACCNTNCTGSDATTYQHRCDGRAAAECGLIATLIAAGGDRPAIQRSILAHADFADTGFSRCGAEVIDWLTLRSDVALVRTGYALAADRLLVAKMDTDLRLHLEQRLVTGLADPRPSVRISVLLSMAESGIVWHHAHEIVDVIVTDDSQEVRETALGVLVGTRKARNAR
jgi:hypothetical protein